MTFPLEVRSFLAVIGNVTFAKSQWPNKKDNPRIQDCVIELKDQQGLEDNWRGEISGEYGVGDYASKTQLETTRERLEGLMSASTAEGHVPAKLFNGDFTTIEAQLKGKCISVSTSVKSDKYLQIWIGGNGGGRAVEVIENSVALNLIAELSKPVGEGGGDIFAEGASAPAAPADDPFAV